MKLNELIRRGGAYSRILLVASALATTPYLAGCGGDDNGGGGTTTEDSGTGTQDSGSGTQDSGGGTQDSGSQPDTSIVDSGTPDTNPQPFVGTPSFSPPPGTFTTQQSVTITSSTQGATIHYTTDGTTPNSSSTVYSAALSISQTTTIKAVAQKAGFQDSAIATGTYTINIPAGTLQTPQPQPNGGTSNNDVTVSLTTNQPGATICYTLDGSVPACDAATATCQGTSQTYNASSRVLITQTGTALNAIACEVGFTTSPAITTPPVYVLQAAPTTATGTDPYAYNSTSDIGSITIGSTIHLNIGTTQAEPTDPTCFTSNQFANGGPGGTQTLTQDTVIKTIVCKANYVSSGVTKHVFHVVSSTPTNNTAGGAFTNDVSVTLTAGLSSGTGSHLCYTLDNSSPTCATTTTPDGPTSTGACATGSSTYAGAFNVTTNAANTVRVVECDPGLQQSAQPTPQTYTLTVSPITMSPDPGTTFADPVNNQVLGVTLAFGGSDPTAGSGTPVVDPVICYRTDGQAAACNATNNGCATGSSQFNTANGTTGTGAFTATGGVPVTAVGCKPGYNPTTPPFSQAYSPAGTVDQPQFVNPPGLYDNIQYVDISVANATANSFVCYTTDGSAPACHPAAAFTDLVPCDSGNALLVGDGVANSGTPGTGEVTMDTNNTVLKAVGCDPALNQSPAQQGTYTFKMGTPGFNPPPGPIDAGASITFTDSTTNPTPEYHWCVGGGIFNAPPTPTCATGTSNQCGVGNSVAFATNFIFNQVSVVACDPATKFQASDPANGTWQPRNGPVTFNVPGTNGGNTAFDNSTIQVQLNDVTNFAQICYTTDGSNPTCNSSQVCGSDTGTANPAINPGQRVTIGPNPNGQPAVTLRAMACDPFYPNTAVTSDTYMFNVSPITLTPTGSAGFTGTETVTIALAADANIVNADGSQTSEYSGDPAGAQSVTSGATICYNTVGTAACNAGNNGCLTSDDHPIANNGTVSFTTTTNLSVIACKPNFNSSANSGSYTATPYRHTITIDGVNDFVDANEGFAGSDGSSTGYIAYDTSNLYLGLSGWTASPTNYIDFYVSGVGATQTSTPETGYPSVGAAGAVPTLVQYHIRYRTDGGDPSVNAATVEKWNGSAWVNSGFTADARANGQYFELSVGLSQLGLSTSSVVDILGGQVDSGSRTDAFPSGGPQWVELNLSEATVPNDASNLRP